MKYFIGADLGTSALKLLLVNSSGEIIKTALRCYSVYYPNAGWSEQNPEDWWNAFLSGVKELVQDINPAEIAGIGVAGQMHGLVVLESWHAEVVGFGRNVVRLSRPVACGQCLVIDSDHCDRSRLFGFPHFGFLVPPGVVANDICYGDGLFCHS